MSGAPISGNVITYGSNDKELIKFDEDESGNRTTAVSPQEDGLVREAKTKKVVSREEIQERTETEDVKHYGDFTDKVSRFFIEFHFFFFAPLSLPVARKRLRRICK